MKRPAIITVLCLLLGWQTLAGVGNAYLILTGQFAGLPGYLGFFSAANSAATLMASLDLWRMKVRGLYWLRIWMVICLAMGVAMIPSFRDIAAGGTLGILGFDVFVGALFWLLNQYVSSRVQAVA